MNKQRLFNAAIVLTVFLNVVGAYFFFNWVGSFDRYMTPLSSSLIIAVVFFVVITSVLSLSKLADYLGLQQHEEKR